MDMISVVIPLYNKGPYIARAVDSVLAQTVQNFEIIVVDDGSTDSGGDVVKKIDSPKIRLFQQKNYGVSAARNFGISQARGDLIAFLDADDEWKPKFLEAIIHLRKLFPQAGAFATAKEYFIEDGSYKIKKLDILPPGTNYGLIEDYFKILLKFPLSSSSIAAPIKVLHEIGCFRLFEELSEDVDTWLRIALRYPIAWCNEGLAILHKDVENRAAATKRFFDEPIVSRTIRHAIEAGIVPSSSIEEIREYSARFQIEAARDCLTNNRRIETINLLRYAKGTRKFSQMWWILRIFSALPFNLGSALWRMLDQGAGRGIKNLLKKKFVINTYRS